MNWEGEANPKYKDGRSRDDRYGLWLNMRSRCFNPNLTSYKYYGGRGIIICDRWLDFTVFCADMGPRPKGWTIERMDNSRGYEPGNCCWASPATQSRNRRFNVTATIGGVTKTRAEWCRDYGISESTVRNRVLRSGWPLERAVTTPVGGR
jgi:hypothetical protein